jgi:hypothetical protein
VIEKGTISMKRLLNEQDQLRDHWLKEKLETVLPEVWNRHNLDMWIIIGQEYREDPISYTLFPSSIDSSRRLTIFVFYQKGNSGLKRYVIQQNPHFSPFYSLLWTDRTMSQWDCLREFILERKPEKIGINTSEIFPMCDGLSHTSYVTLSACLGGEYAKRLVSAEYLAMDWLQTRSPGELEMYPKIADMARMIASECLSKQVIIPNQTTTVDVVNWIRQKVFNMGIGLSFYPTVDIQRKGEKVDRINETTIIAGDIVHLDFGIHYLGLSTDTQLLGYVLKSDEVDVPEGLKKGLAKANYVEDLIQLHFKGHRTGNDIFDQIINQCESEGINMMLYSHPLGVHCHGAGPTIGLYDEQKRIPIKGDICVSENTCYAMEFNVKQFVPEWEQDVTFYLEESVYFKNNKLDYLTSRQTEYYLI